MTVENTKSDVAWESGHGTDELTALAQYCLAAADDILSPPGQELWASARLLDGLAVIAHGSHTPVSEVARSAFPASVGPHAWPDTTSEHRVDDAAFLLGVYAFSENYADTGLGSVAHVNSIVVPALLIGMQQRVVTGRQALAALVVGYNVMEWAGAILNGGRPRMAHQLRGFRPTPSVGPLAAVAVLGRLAGYPADELANALGLACYQGGGLRPSLAAPTAAIWIQSGEALRRAVHTLRLARLGIVTHPEILRCSGGYYPAYVFGEPGRYNLPVPGQRNDPMTAVSMKLECTPHTLVTMLDAARTIAARHPGIAAVDVESVTVRVPSQHNVISGGKKQFPVTFSQAADHVPYCVALAMVTGSHLFPSVMTSGLGNEQVRALTEKVTLVIDDTLGRLFDEDTTSWPATVEVLWSDGDTDTLAMRAPETVEWTADDAARHAAMKAVALLGDTIGTGDTLIAQFRGAPEWSDCWQQLRDHPIARATPEACHGN